MAEGAAGPLPTRSGPRSGHLSGSVRRIGQGTGGGAPSLRPRPAQGCAHAPHDPAARGRGGSAETRRRDGANARVVRQRSSEPCRPRAMRGQPQGWVRSVSRGTCRPCIEPRKYPCRECRRRPLVRKATSWPSVCKTVRDSPGSKTTRMHGTISRATREIPGSPVRTESDGAQREG